MRGLFQKFILADILYTFALNSTLVDQITSSRWMWAAVLAYSLRLYLDFNGYTHIAIGIGQLLGVNLPENFRQPFRSPTLTIFWNNWHITLTQWFRGYYFNPISRYIRRKWKSVNPKPVLFMMQVSTMILIGLWHGLNWNFVIWGVWSGVGLFIDNRISAKAKQKNPSGQPWWQVNPILKIISTSVVFLYVTLGWVWFALPDVESSMYAFKVLFLIQ